MATETSGEEKTRRARVLYDFEGDGDENQLSISTGQMLTLIGDVTPENWILARTGDNVEGWIPDGYYDIVTSPKKRMKPPPAPKNAVSSFSSAGSSFTDKSKKVDDGYVAQKESRGDSIIFEKNDTFSLFTYQFEWFTIVCIFLGAVITFMHSTPQPDVNKWRMSICAWLAFVMSAISAYICGVNRHKFKIKESAAIVRGIVFIVSGILLAIGYPTGIPPAVVCLCCGAVEIRLHYYNCKDLPSKVTDEWCSTMFGGTENCPPGKLIIFFVVLSMDCALFGWGYVNGANFALEVNDDNPSYYLNEIANGFMFGFGRIISGHLCVILLLSCKVFTNFIYVCVIGIPWFSAYANKHTDWSISDFVHRCLGYSIVWASFLHLVCVYYTYEDSGSTRSFMDVYKIETFVTGILVLMMLAFVVASSNDVLSKQNSRLFHQTHRQALIIIVLLIFHGASLLSTFYWMLIIVPIIFYSCNAFLRYLKGN